MKHILTIVILFWSGSFVCADDLSTIDSLVGREIFISDGWAGQSLKVVKADDGYQVIRTFYGSGRPVVGTATYRARAAGRYQLRFPATSDSGGVGQRKTVGEEFILTIVEGNRIQLLFNGLQIVAALNPAKLE